MRIGSALGWHQQEVCVNRSMIGGRAREFGASDVVVRESQTTAKEQAVQGAKRERTGECIDEGACAFEAGRNEVFRAEVPPEIIEIASDDESLCPPAQRAADSTLAPGPRQ